MYTCTLGARATYSSGLTEGIPSLGALHIICGKQHDIVVMCVMLISAHCGV